MVPPARCSTLSTLATSLFDSKIKVCTLFTIPLPAHLQYCQGEVLASTQFYGNESLHSNSTIGMSVFERSVEAPFVALFALWIFVVMPVVLSDTFYLTRKLSRVCTVLGCGPR